MFKFNPLRIGITSFLALAIGLSTARADEVIGVTFPGTKPRSPTPVVKPAPAPAPIAQIKHKRVITVKTYVKDRSGNLSTVNMDFTTHIWNPKLNIWEEQQWGANYIRTLQGLKERGWSAYDSERTNPRTVTGN